MKKLNVTVQCMAVYNSSIEVPDEMCLTEAIRYAKEHINEINCGELEYISDSDVLDEENCDFVETEEVTVYEDCLNKNRLGDFVRCSDCGELMLMQLGDTACGECESENLQWADDNMQECTPEQLEELGYIIVEK